MKLHMARNGANRDFANKFGVSARNLLIALARDEPQATSLERTFVLTAVKYIRRQLGQGKSLAKTLLETVDFEQGDIITLSPTPLSPTEAMQFERGHTPQTPTKPERIKIGDSFYLAVPKTTAYEQLAETIYDELTTRRSVCFLENYLAEAHDGWLQRAKSRVVTHGNEVYHALLSADRDKDNIVAAIREWHLPTCIGALGSMNEETSAHIASARIITTGQLTAFAETVQSVFVGAYDEEGYVVWNQRSG
jgi:hypothetical protein